MTGSSTQLPTDPIRKVGLAARTLKGGDGEGERQR